MKIRLFLAAALAFPSLTLVGCGGSTPTPAEISKEPMTEDDIAKANADIDQASDAERAFQKENPVGKPAGKKP